MAYYGKRTPNRPSVKQVSIIHTLAHKLGWSDNRYHDELQHRYHVASCKKLTLAQTRDFINFLQAEFEKAFGSAPYNAWQPATAAGETAKAKAQAAGRATPERMTQKQREYAVKLWWEYSRGQTAQEKLAGLRAFVKRQTGCDDLKFVPREQASVIITALEVATGRKQPKKTHQKGICPWLKTLNPN